MCLYPKLIRNRKFSGNKKNGGNIPEMKDERTRFVPVACGKCIECKKQKARDWQVRLNEEQKIWKYIYCKTFTFENKKLNSLCKESGLKESNAVATIAVRRFLERWRKKYGKSLRHWLVTELGHDNTERIHLHGIIFSNTPIPHEEINNIWYYGNVDEGDWYGLRTINYLIKYVHKVDTDHKNFEQIVLCSKGIGANYLERSLVRKIHRFDNENTIEYYRLSSGAKISLPIYYRNKLWTDEERELLWLHRLDKEERYVLGNKIDVSTTHGISLYNKVLNTAQEMNKKLGFGDDSKEWKKRDYNITWKMLRSAKKKGQKTRTRRFCIIS